MADPNGEPEIHKAYADPRDHRKIEAVNNADRFPFPAAQRQSLSWLPLLKHFHRNARDPFS
jgi:hypothetical protein